MAAVNHRIVELLYSLRKNSFSRRAQPLVVCVGTTSLIESRRACPEPVERGRLRIAENSPGRSPISANLFRMFFVKLPQNRHPERSASQIDRVT
jgi:hypothetical protein